MITSNLKWFQFECGFFFTFLKHTVLVPDKIFLGFYGNQIQTEGKLIFSASFSISKFLGHLLKQIWGGGIYTAIVEKQFNFLKREMGWGSQVSSLSVMYPIQLHKIVL
uniref:Uncharacterized protein n=1 Tax=Micrurus lemniscatus lemniscatus TaxID=129467 RepID=A0A2D4HZ62_MICLE